MLNQKQEKFEHQKRAKPAIPTKPINIPPLPAPVQQSSTVQKINISAPVENNTNVKPKSTERPKQHEAFKAGYNNIKIIGASGIATSSSTSPNCSNDCCGILLNTISTNTCYNEKLSNMKSTIYDSNNSLSSSNSNGFKDESWIKATKLQNQQQNIEYSGTTNTIKPQNIQNIVQYQQSSKQLEHILVQRLEKEISQNPNRFTGISCNIKNKACGEPHDPPGAQSTIVSSAIQMKIQQKLQQEMKQQMKCIQDKFLIEKRFPQEAYKWDDSSGGMGNRGQPPIGSKQTPVLRPTIFETGTTIQQNQILKQPQPLNGKSNVTGGTEQSNELTDQNSLVYRDGNLISGSLQALIQHMVPTGVYYPDKSYLFAFLLSSRLFIKPYELLEQICLICERQQNLNSYSTSECNLENTQILVNFTNQFIQFLTEWMEIFPYDFRDDRIMQHVRYMTQKLIKIDPKLSKECSKLLQNLLQRLKILDNYEEFLRKINLGELSFISLTDNELLINSCNMTNSSQNNPQSSTHSQSSQQYVCPTIDQSTASLSTLSISGSSQSSIAQQIGGIDLTEMCPNPGYLAQQLTHIELERLYHIGPEEFVQAFAKDNPNVTTTIKDIKKTKNLEAYVQWFNRLSYLVASEIVKFSKKKQRVRLIEYWIETARECFNIGNFNSLMAIIAGLNMAPILRLKKTWAKIQSAKFSILEHQMDPSSNFNSYRSTLKAAMWRSAGATDERQRIVIPFFSLLVKDLYFLNEGCSNKLPNGHINFEKFWQLAKQVTEFIAWKQVTCPFTKNIKIIMLLQTCNILNENTLSMTSFECEPPDNNLEKDRYKTLKQEYNH